MTSGKRDVPTPGPAGRALQWRAMAQGVFWVAILVALDQATKAWILETFPLGGARTIVPGFFDLTHYRNPGAAFGMLRGAPESLRVPFFIIVSLATTGVLAYLGWQSRPSQRLFRVSLILLCAGALGNLVDRIRFGEVVDFLLVYYGRWSWPAFNVADSLISIGVTLLLFDSFFGQAKGEPQPAAAPGGSEGTD